MVRGRGFGVPAEVMAFVPPLHRAGHIDVYGPLSWSCFAATCFKTVLTCILRVPSRIEENGKTFCIFMLMFWN